MSNSNIIGTPMLLAFDYGLGENETTPCKTNQAMIDAFFRRYPLLWKHALLVLQEDLYRCAQKYSDSEKPTADTCKVKARNQTCQPVSCTVKEIPGR